MRPISFDPLNLADPIIVPGTETWVITVDSTFAHDYVVLQLSSNFVPPGWDDQLGSLGATVVDVLPPASYVVRIPPGSKALLGGLPLRRWSGDYLPGYRVPPDVVQAAATLSGDYLDVWLVLFPDEDPAAYLAILPVLVPGIVIEGVFDPGLSTPWSRAQVAVSIPASGLPLALERLAGLEALEMMDLRGLGVPANDDNLGWVQSGLAEVVNLRDLDHDAPAFRSGITGLGETVAVADSGLENDMCFFRWGRGQAATTQGQFLPPPCVAGGGGTYCPPPCPDPRNQVPCPMAAPVDASKKVVAYYWHHTDTQYDSACAIQAFHGTHVAGTAVGDAVDDLGSPENLDFLAKNDDLLTNSWPEPLPNPRFGFNIDHHQTGDGMAPGAQLLVQDLQNETICFFDGLRFNIAQRHEQAYFSHAPDGSVAVRHHSNSWGILCNGEGGHPNIPVPQGWPYTQEASDGDGFSWAHRDFNVFFGAGNEGTEPARLRNPAQMKNCLAVGNSTSPGVPPGEGGSMRGLVTQGSPPVTTFGSSHGPAAGVRIKPDISAPGVTTLSAGPDSPTPETGQGLPPTGNYDCDIRQMTGTSMATPVLTGLSALLRQYLREGRYPNGVPNAPRGFSPTSALIKGLLVNSTRSVWTGSGQTGFGDNTADIGTGKEYRPTMGQGWGRPVIDDIINFGPTDDYSVVPRGTLERTNMLILTDTPNGLNTLETNDGRPAALEDFRTAIRLGQIHESTFVVTSASEGVFVTLAWADLWGSVAAADPLVDDLDLEVIDPGGKVWRPEPGSPPYAGDYFGTAPRLWDTGFSHLGAQFIQQQASQPPFTNFSERDERNNLENVFVRPADVVTGTWTVRVIFYNGPATSTDEYVWPDLIPGSERCNYRVDEFGVLLPLPSHPGWDCASTADQGYALIVSGAVARPVPDLGTPFVTDSCHAPGDEPPDGQLDRMELVNLYIPLTTEVAREDVIGCLEALPPNDLYVHINESPLDLPPSGPTTCAVYGDMPAGSTANGRFAIMLDASHPAADAQFTLSVFARPPGTRAVEPLAAYPVAVPHQMTVLLGANPTPTMPGMGDCGSYPLDPELGWTDQDGGGFADDLTVQFCPGSLGTTSGSFNIYAGDRHDWTPLPWDHVSLTVPAWCNLPCNDGLYSWGGGADGRCEVVLLNQKNQSAPSQLLPYYLISAEATCSGASLGAGAEGRLGTHGTIDIPYGGGVCP